MFRNARPREIDADADDRSARFDATPRSSPRGTPGSRRPSPSRSPRDDAITARSRAISQHGDIWDNRRNSPGAGTPPRTPEAPTIYGNRMTAASPGNGDPPTTPIVNRGSSSNRASSSGGALEGSPGGSSLGLRRGASSHSIDPRSIGPGGIYHEKLVGRHTAVQCVNNLLQENRISQEHLRKTAEQLDRAEQRLTGGRARDYGNVRNDGYFNLQVVQAVFSALGYEVHAVRGSINLEGESAFLLNKNRHWLCVRRLGTGWFDLNSCLQKPEHYNAHDLQEHLMHVQNYGYNILVVRGEFPPTPLEEDPEKLADAVRGCLRPLGTKTSHAIEVVDGLDVMADDKPLPAEYKVPSLWRFSAHWFGASRFQHHPTAPQTHSSWQNADLAFKKKLLKVRKRNLHDASLDEEDAADHVHADMENPQTPPSNRNMAFAEERQVPGLGLESPGPQSPGGPVGELLHRLDKDGDGVFNLNDLDDILAAEVDEIVLEEEATSWPILVVAQLLIAGLFWLVESIKSPDASGWLFTKAGLENVFPGRTTALVYRDCISLRWEVWRWWSYQYTHVSVSHVGMNSFILVVAGFPLEAFQGHWRIFLLFNAGVFSGALASMVWNVRSEVVGMSAGCYTLLLVHLAELLLNWKQTRFRFPKLFLIVFIIGADIANIQLTQLSDAVQISGQLEAVSHSAHIAGGITGLLLGILFTRNLVVYRCERALQLIPLAIWLGMTAYHIVYLLQWPPRTSIDPEPWCWAAQVFNQSFFGDMEYHCVRCADLDCIARWQQQRWVYPVDWAYCKYQFGFVTD